MRPRVSVVIPCRDVAGVIHDQLEALSRQTFGEPFEVVLSDNGGSEDLSALARGWRDEYPLDIRVVDARDRQGVSHARNTGLREAHGELVAICDADDVVSDDWLRALTEAASQAHVVGGAVDTASLNPPDVRTWRPGPSLEHLPRKFGFLPYAMGCNVMVDRESALAAGGWDEDYVAGGDDIEFSWRMQLAGHDIAFAREAVVHYRYRTDLRGAVRQAYAYGRTDPRLARDHVCHGVPAPVVRQRCVIDARWLAREVRLLLRGRGPRGLWLCRAAGLCGRVRGVLTPAPATRGRA